MDDRGNRHDQGHRPFGRGGPGHPGQGRGHGHGSGPAPGGQAQGHHHGPTPGHGRGEGHAERGPGEGRGRGAPPESTGAETNYIIKNMQAKTPMVVRLMNNEEVRGWIEYYDRRIIKLNRAQPPHLLIRKENIKYMYKDEEAAPPSSRDRS